MKSDILSRHCYRIPPAKVALLGFGTFGLYLIYWYFLQYTLLNKDSDVPFNDLLKGTFFVACSVFLSKKISDILQLQSKQSMISGVTLFTIKIVAQLLLVTLAILISKQKIMVFILLGLSLESVYACLLQYEINRNHLQVKKNNFWQEFKMVHIFSLCAVCGLWYIASILR